MIALGLLLAIVALAAVVGLAAELRRRAELVARAAHELRGPLTAAALALHAARRAAPDGPVASLDAVQAQLERAARAVADVERAGHGRGPTVVRAAVDLAALLQAQAAAWGPVAAADGRAVRIASLPPRAIVDADPRLLGQALGNLIANALDHAAGDVVLAARGRRERLRIEVRDGHASGAWRPGRPAAVGRRRAVAVRRARLFAAVRRGGRRRHGHGLRVAADVAARHGGRLLLARDAAGAVAILELPRPAARAAPPRRRRGSAGGRADARRTRVPA